MDSNNFGNGQWNQQPGWQQAPQMNSAPQMNAAAPSNAFSSLGEQLGNSVNTALTADAIKAGIRKTDAETDLTKSLDTGK